MKRNKLFVLYLLFWSSCQGQALPEFGNSELFYGKTRKIITENIICFSEIAVDHATDSLYLGNRERLVEHSTVQELMADSRVVQFSIYNPTWQKFLETPVDIRFTLDCFKYFSKSEFDIHKLRDDGAEIGVSGGQFMDENLLGIPIRSLFEVYEVKTDQGTKYYGSISILNRSMDPMYSIIEIIVSLDADSLN